MRYATEGIHYDNDEELDLLRQRAPTFFDMRVDVQQSVEANGDRSTRAQQLLLRLSQNAGVHDDHIMTECSVNTLHGVVDWMCNNQDIDRTKREGGGSYDTATFKKFVRFQTRENQMLKTGGGEELKPNAAEILALSRMNEEAQRDLVDYHELATMVVDGVEYVLLDQIVHFMKSGGEDKNLIHEALHEVTEDAIAAAEVVDVECVKGRTLDLVSGDPVPRGNIFEAVEELTAALTDVDRRRKRKQGWEIVVREHNSTRTHTRDIIVQDVGGAVSLSDVTTVLKNPAADARTVHGGFSEWRLAPIRPSGDFNEGGEQPSWQGDDAVVRSDDKGDAQTRPQQENPALRDLEVSGSDINSDKEGEEYDLYWDVKRGGGQTTKGWCHAILRLARYFSKPHPLIRVVDKVATPDGLLHFVAIKTIMSCIETGKRWTRTRKSWFVLIQKKTILTTSMSWGVNLSCVIHGAAVTACGATVHPTMSTTAAIIHAQPTLLLCATKDDNIDAAMDMGRTSEEQLKRRKL
ncbi:hypothetical protein CBR_g29691 [Chara braunii]|uniref:Uncharacterized protein n=1 Tax=Chara braunii TaxID=69332 RepID=A0A388LB82_CHABU|nr:hypothetical protein CBR_g29691 [Chara braunii]|eukprot:GBG79544.1 hypothetical protein CBR_g29691 [Chara braunii]